MTTGRTLLPDKVAVITGAGSGVGRASALRFAQEGAAVVCADVREDWAQETAELVTGNGGRASPSAATSAWRTMSPLPSRSRCEPSAAST